MMEQIFFSKYGHIYRLDQCTMTHRYASDIVKELVIYQDSSTEQTILFGVLGFVIEITGTSRGGQTGRRMTTSSHGSLRVVAVEVERVGSSIIHVVTYDMENK